MKILNKILLTILFICFSVIGFAADKIEDFQVILKLDKKGFAEVTEKITFVSEENYLRGIRRKFHRKRGDYFKVESLKLDGNNQSYYITTGEDISSVFLGGENPLSNGRHTYEFIYKKSLVLDYGLQEYKLVWNVTGKNYLPIEKASFILQVPPKTKVIKDNISSYIYSKGTKRTDINNNSAAYFETTSPLKSYEEFFVEIPLLKDSFDVPTRDMVKVNANYILFAILMLYLIITWLLFGKDPVYKGRIRHTPPEGLTPAMAGFILKRKTNARTFITILLSLASKKIINIEYGIELFLEKTNSEEIPLPKEELYLLNNLLFLDRFFITGEYQPSVEIAAKDTEEIIQNICDRYIKTNSSLLYFPNLILTIMFCLSLKDASAALQIGSFAFLLMPLFFRNRRKFFFILPLIALCIYFFISMEMLYGGPINFIMYTIGYISMFIYYYTIDNASPEGKDIYLQTKAFEKYIKKLCKSKTQIADDYEAKDIFHKYLPYAYAFGLEQQWIKTFERTMPNGFIEEEIKSYGGKKFLTQKVEILINSATMAPNAKSKLSILDLLNNEIQSRKF